MNKTEMWDYPKMILHTKFGDREVMLTEADHAHVSHTGYEGGTAIPMGPVRGISYHVSAHLYKWPDGTWHIGSHPGFGFNYEVLDEALASHPEQWAMRQSNNAALYMGRYGSFSTDASKPARKAIGTEIERAFNEWAATPEAATLFAEAEEKHLRRELEDKTAKMNEAFAAYQVAEKEANAANDALSAFLDKKAVEVTSG